MAHPETFGLEPSQLPELVTFDDPNKPDTIRPIMPSNLKTLLGEDVSWCSITLGIVSEPATSTLEIKLKWLASMNTIQMGGSNLQKVDFESRGF
jgi:hypothetical protein